MSYRRRPYRKSWLKRTLRDWSFLFVPALLIIAVAVGTAFNFSVNGIDQDRMVDRLQENGVVEIEVVRHTNRYPVFGNPTDVTFEVIVDGQHQSVRCTDGWFQDMVCRQYNE